MEHWFALEARMVTEVLGKQSTLKNLCQGNLVVVISSFKTLFDWYDFAREVCVYTYRTRQVIGGA